MVSLIPKNWVDFSCKDSLAFKFRKKRMDFFRYLFKELPKPIKILDLGGTELFWRKMDFANDKDFRIVILNLTLEKVHYTNFKSIVGDARDLSQFEDKEFDVVFSNSMIEHLSSFEEQRRVALEVGRIGKHYFIQTPNRYFPIEPHFLFPFFNFLPKFLQAWLLTKFDLGQFSRTNNIKHAKKIINSINMLSRDRLKILFPHCNIFEEKFLGLTKSFIVYR